MRKTNNSHVSRRVYGAIASLALATTAVLTAAPASAATADVPQPTARTYCGAGYNSTTSTYAYCGYGSVSTPQKFRAKTVCEILSGDTYVAYGEWKWVPVGSTYAYSYAYCDSGDRATKPAYEITNE